MPKRKYKSRFQDSWLENPKKNLLNFCENLLENLLKSPKKSKSKSAMTPGVNVFYLLDNLLTGILYIRME